MKIKDLSNSEVLFLYLSNKSVLDKYNSAIELRSYKNIVQIFDLGEIIINHSLTDEEIEDMLDNDHYKYVVEINDKLQPIAELISEADTNLYDKIYSLINKDTYI